jgi:hypothetical protein
MGSGGWACLNAANTTLPSPVDLPKLLSLNVEQASFNCGSAPGFSALSPIFFIAPAEPKRPSRIHGTWTSLNLRELASFDWLEVLTSIQLKPYDHRGRRGGRPGRRNRLKQQSSRQSDSDEVRYSPNWLPVVFRWGLSQSNTMAGTLCFRRSSGHRNSVGLRSKEHLRLSSAGVRRQRRNRHSSGDRLRD